MRAGRIISIIIISCCALFASCTVFAGISLSPSTVELVMAAGDIYKGAYTVVNDSAEPAHVKVEMEDWLKARTGRSELPPEVWLRVDPMEFDLEGHGSKTVEYEIDMPAGCEGEFVAMVFFGTSSMGGAFNLTGRIGVSIYAAVEGTIKLDAELLDIDGRSNIRNEEGKIENKGIMFILNVKNKGNVHIRPTGTIVVTGMDGKTYDISIERSFPVYPGLNQVYPVAWDKTDIEPGAYKAEIILDYGNIYNEDKKLIQHKEFTVQKDGTVSF